MAKKFSKLVLFSALAGAAAAGTYYYLHKKTTSSEDELEDFDDFDDFDEDLDDEDFSSDSVNSTGSKNRPYVSIDIDNAKEIIGEKVIETLDKTKEKLEHLNVSEKIDKAKEIISEMTSPSVEPVYTQVNMSSTPTSDAATSENVPTGSVSVTYAESSNSEETSEEFFDDSEVKSVE
ncbi:hypothetical protein IMSAGC011_00845 [Lachnospiraceae bacterium]|nr:hypothetical protein IMSAGC011_00845 [Lachnospiraceae bacterium]